MAPTTSCRKLIQLEQFPLAHGYVVPEGWLPSAP